MAKEFKDITFNPIAFKKELGKFEALLKSKEVFGEKEIQHFFDESLHLTAYIGVGAALGIGIAKQVASQFVCADGRLHCGYRVRYARKGLLSR